jgi:hypothetical protein
VARIGELRYRDNWSITKIRDQLQIEAQVSIARKAVSLLCEVFLALVTTVAYHDQALIEPLRMLAGIVLAMDGVQPEKRHATRYLLREVRSGRVFVAKTLLSSATADIALLIEDVLGLGMPIVGVLSDTQASICLAVQHTLPTVPHQICQDHSLKDMAQPLCDADRHVKKELHKQVRGIRDLARHAEKALTKDAPVVTDSCVAIRTVMRDEGQYPRDPPGVKLSQQLPLMAASVERVMVVHPSALLKKLSRMRDVLHLFQPAFEPLMRLVSWLYHMAHLFNAETSDEDAQAPLLTFVHQLKHRCPHEARLS